MKRLRQGGEEVEEAKEVEEVREENEGGPPRVFFVSVHSRAV